MLRRSLGTQAYTRLAPYVYPERAAFRAVNLGPNLTIARGTVLGLVTATADDVQTISDTPTVTAGTFTISGTNPLTGEAFTTDDLAYNVAIADLETELEAHLGTGNVAVTGGPLPGTDVVLTAAGDMAARPLALMTIDSSALTGGTLAIAHTTTGRTAGTAVAYDDDGTDDGRRTAIGIAQYDMESDDEGYIYLGELVSGRFQRFEAGNVAVDIYTAGYFKTDELVGLDAAAVTDLHGRLWKGTLADGVLMIPG